MTTDQIALQLYTLRAHLQNPTQIRETLKKVSAIGYRAVQISGVGTIDDMELLQILKGEGLTICATHEPSDLIRREPERTAERVANLGCLYSAYAFPAGVDWSKKEDVEQLVKDLDHAGSVFRKMGLTLCYHHHAIEFIRFQDTIALEYIFENTKAANLAAELDVYWLQYGGVNPADWCRKMKGRLPLLHIKDYAYTTENKPTYASIGGGNLSWPDIIAAGDYAGCKWFIVEQDETPGDPFDAIADSLQFIKSNLLSPAGND